MERLGDPWGNVMSFCMHVMRVLEGKESHKWKKICIKRIMTGNVSNLYSLRLFNL